MDIVVAIDGRIFACPLIYLFRSVVVPCHACHHTRKNTVAIVVFEIAIESQSLGRSGHYRIGIDRNGSLGAIVESNLRSSHLVRTIDESCGNSQCTLCSLRSACSGDGESFACAIDDCLCHLSTTSESNLVVVGRRKTDVLVKFKCNHTVAIVNNTTFSRIGAYQYRSIHLRDSVLGVGVAAGCQPEGGSCNDEI